MEKRKGKGISLMMTLLLMGAVPLIVVAVIMIVIATSSIRNEVEKETYDKLKVAGEAVNQYFAYDIKNNGQVDYSEYADHEYMESVQTESVELTLFKGDTRFITSLKNADGSYNEGTKASDEVFAAVSKGEEFTSNDVVINGVEYYVYYEPIYDGNNAFWGMAFAGTPQVAVKKAMNAAIFKLIFSAIIVAITFSVVTAILAIKIRKSISLVADSLSGLSQGDLSIRIDDKDFIIEISNMMQATDILQEKLSEVIGAVKERSDTLIESINEVDSAAVNVSESTGQIAGAMEELSNSTMVLSENVQDVNMQAITMGDHIQSIAENVETLSSASDDIKAATENAQILMSKVLDSSSQSAEATRDISESIELTNTSIVKITEAVNLITEIATQTNLLSLNASIEAARAGEAGRGFAVVAEEIGKLATDSAATADSIRELANDMNDKSSRTVELAGKIDSIIAEEKEIVESTQQAFESLGASIEESLAMITEIDTKATELSTLKEGILGNISDLSAISEENAASNQEVTASVTGISENINGMSEQCNSMQEMSEQLQMAISYFRY